MKKLLFIACKCKVYVFVCGIFIISRIFYSILGVIVNFFNFEK